MSLQQMRGQSPSRSVALGSLDPNGGVLGQCQVAREVWRSVEGVRGQEGDYELTAKQEGRAPLVPLWWGHWTQMVGYWAGARSQEE